MKDYWLEIEAVPNPDAPEDDDIIACFGCMYSEIEYDRDWESGVDESSLYCYAIDDEGNNYHEDNLIQDIPTGYCPFKKEKDVEP